MSGRNPKNRAIAGKALLMAIVLVIVNPTLVAAAPAITPTNRPTPIAGQVNGEVLPSQLITVVPGCRVARAAGPSLSLLLKSAQARGITVTATDCYRPLSGQVAVSQSWSGRGNSACAATPTFSPTGKVVGTSMHGWGKAVDFGFGGPTFNSNGYRYLKNVAAAYGWNHPGWAEPGGSACPEAWHWEWLGDGGADIGTPVRADVVALLPNSNGSGYAGVTGLGAISAAGAFDNVGSVGNEPLNWVMVGAASTPSKGGYWMVGADGGVFSFGGAPFHGSTGAMVLNKPVVGMGPTPTGGGYWTVASDGGVFSFGDARFYGSMGGKRLAKGVVGMAPNSTGNGYWLVASDGGIFSFGDAQFHGSTGGMVLNQPVVAMAATPSGNGYWLVASDGGVFAFGDASFAGSAGGNPPAQPVVAITPTPSGKGYWLTSAGGEVYSYGDASPFGNV